MTDDLDFALLQPFAPRSGAHAPSCSLWSSCGSPREAVTDDLDFALLQPFDPRSGAHAPSCSPWPLYGPPVTLGAALMPLAPQLLALVLLRLSA